MKKMTPLRPTLSDVAVAAGVSRSLASLALRGGKGVRAETREMILRAAAELNYAPNLAARNLASGKTSVIGVVVRDIANPYLAALAKGVYDAGRKKGLDVILSVPEPNERDACLAVASLVAQRVQGLVLLDAPGNEATIEQIANETPTIFVGRLLKGERVNCVSTDDELGGRMVARHLLSLGHKVFAHVDGGIGAGAQRRHNSFASELAAANAELTVIPGSYAIDSGSDAAEVILHLSERPTAVFAANDLAALGLLNRFLACGLSVPDDIAIVGYDDMPLAGSETISLTTVRQPIQHLAEYSIAALADSKPMEERPTLRVLVTPELIERRSTLGSRMKL